MARSSAPARREPDPPRQEQPQPDATDRVQLVGTFTVARGSELLSGAALGSRKARTLLALLTVRHGEMVRLDTVIEALWGHDPPAKAPANVAALVSRLRALLGADVVEGGRDGYRLRLPTGCEVDVYKAEDLVGEASDRLAAGEPALAVTASDRALELLGTGEVLTEQADASWADEANRTAAALLARAREIGWQARFELGDPQGSLALAQQSVAADALHEEAHRAVMLAHHALGEPGKALAAYERLRELLADEFGADPSPESEQVYLSVLRGEHREPQPAVQRPVAHLRTGFVGREEELTTAIATWTRAAGGTATCLLITGEAGIGKTRLAGEIAAHAHDSGALAVESRCYRAERSLFLQPVVEAVRRIVATVPPGLVHEAAGSLAGPLSTIVPEVGEVLGKIDYQPAGAEVERRRVFEAVGSFLAGVARRRPVLLLLDDLHEAGASTVELCHFVLRWRPAARLLITATARTEQADEAVAQLAQLGETVSLGPLPEAAVRSLAHSAGLDDATAQVLARTRGHTLFVVEALRAMRERAEQGGSRQAVPVPETLRAAVLTRVDRCGQQAAELLRAAVVAGSAFDLDIVAELLDIPVADAARRSELALRAGLLTDAGDAFEFANDLVREIVYESVPAPARTARHRRLATMLADQPEAAALHAAAAGDWEIAAQRWVDAAHRATAAFANHEAEVMLSRAIEAHEHLRLPAGAARARLLRGRALLAQGRRYGRAAADLAEAERLAREIGDDRLEAAAIADRAWAAYYARSMPPAYELAERAMAHSGAGAEVALLAGRMRNTAGDLAGAIAALEPIAEHTEPELRARAMSYLGTVLAHSDRYTDATELLDRAYEQCRRAGLLRPMLNASFFRTMARANLGDFETALRWTERLQHDVDRFSADFYRPRALNVEAWLWRELGEPQRAYDLAQEALERCAMPDGHTEAEPAANALLQLAESALLRGDSTETQRRLAEVSTVAEGAGYAWRIELRSLELQARLDPARADELRERARDRGSAKYEALALAHLGRREEAVSVATSTGSLFLTARVAPESMAQEAVEQLAARLPGERRDAFLRGGALAVGHRTG